MEVGSAAPLHLGASNLVLLAHLEPTRQKAALRHWLVSEAERARLHATLTTIRQQGYVYTVAQLTTGVAAVAVPVADVNGRLLGGLSIGGYAERLTRETAERLLPDLRRASRDLTGALEADEVKELTT